MKQKSFKLWFCSFYCLLTGIAKLFPIHKERKLSQRESHNAAMKKTALITGASNGIGLELAKIFAKEGYDLILIARNKEKLDAVKSNLEAAYKQQIYIYAKDLSEKDAAYDIYNFTQDQHLAIDILVNNAGFGDFGKFLDSDLTKQTEMIQVNVTALVQICHLFTQQMAERKSGKILNIASIAAFQAGPLMAVYYATKAFVLSFSEALSVELKNSGITVTALCPGPTSTGFEQNANLESSGLFKNLKITTAESVALFGYRMLIKNKLIAVPGATNKFIVWAAKLLPRRFMRNMAYRIQK